MRDAPGTRDLIETAREALKAEVMPELSGDAKYAAAMAVNALGIALRDMDGTDDFDAAERTALQGLLGSRDDDLAALNAALARALREGRIDPRTDEAAAAALRAQVVARLMRVNPKALAAERDEGRIPKDFTPWDTGT